MIDYREICAALADAVYGGEHESSIPSDQGWSQVDLDGDNVGDYVTSINGFAAAAYTDGSGNIVISYRGSSPDDPSDWLLNNLPQAFDITQDQFSNAVDFYKQIFDLFPDKNITVTGHSLGGALAQMMGAYVESGRINEVNNPDQKKLWRQLSGNSRF